MFACAPRWLRSLSTAALILACAGPGCTDDGASEADEQASEDEGGEADATISAAGWSFGECLGKCSGTLTLAADDALDLAILDWETQTTVGNTGTLTAAGREQIDAAAAALVGVALDETYGCPDCDDGGASRITLIREGQSTEHNYEFSNPPAELAPADALVTELIAALRTCTDGELLTLDEGCEPIEP